MEMEEYEEFKKIFRPEALNNTHIKIVGIMGDIHRLEKAYDTAKTQLTKKKHGQEIELKLSILNAIINNNTK